MDQKELNKRINEFNELVLSEDSSTTSPEPSGGAVESQMVENVDLYEQGRRERFNASKKQYPNGSSPRTTVALMVALDNLRPRYQKAKDDNDYLSRIGDNERARMARDGYMNDYFLPAVESLVNLYGADEIINNRNALSKLDNMTLVNGGSGTGYTAAFIRTLHSEDRGIAPAISDGKVVNALKDIRKMIAMDQIRNAVSLAKKIKTSIENGNNAASPEDYEVIQKIALRGQ